MSDKLPPEDEMSDWTTEFWSDPPAAPDPVGSEKAATKEQIAGWGAEAEKHLLTCSFNDKQKHVRILSLIARIEAEQEYIAAYRDGENDTINELMETHKEQQATIKGLKAEKGLASILRELPKWKEMTVQLKAAREWKEIAEGLVAHFKSCADCWECLIESDPAIAKRYDRAALPEMDCPECKEGKAHAHPFPAEMGGDDE